MSFFKNVYTEQRERESQELSNMVSSHNKAFSWQRYLNKQDIYYSEHDRSCIPSHIMDILYLCAMRSFILVAINSSKNTYLYLGVILKYYFPKVLLLEMYINNQQLVAKKTR